MEQNGVYEFGPYQLDAVQRVLHRDGKPVLITPKAFEVLLALVKGNGQVISKEELMSEVWPSTFVEPNNLAFNISLLRKALGENGQEQGQERGYIETVPKRGYRFVATVTAFPAANGNGRPSSTAEFVSKAKPSRSLFSGRILGILAAITVLIALGTGTMFWVRREQGANSPVPGIRQLTTNTDDNPIENAVISPDGKYLAYGDSAGIQIRLIDTGESHLFPMPPSLSGSDLWFPVAWSPDGSKLVANSITSKTTAAWSVSVIGGTARLLRDNVLARSISPDGSMIAFLKASADDSENAINHHLIKGAEIWVMGFHGENARKIVSGDPLAYIGSVAWSPSGGRIAFQRFHLEGGQSVNYRIETCSLAGGALATVFEKTHYRNYAMDHAFPEDFLWLSDGRIVYAVREPAPTIRDSNLWAVKVDEGSGRRLSDPARLTRIAGFHMEGLSASADRKRIVFESSTDQSYVYVADISGSDRLSHGRRLTTDERYNTPYAWTSDSRAVIFRSDRSGRFGIYKQELDKQVPDLIDTGAGSPGYPRLSPDGKWVIYPDGEYPKQDRLMRVPLAGGPAQVIFKRPDIDLYDCPRQPGLPCLVLESSSDDKEDVFFDFDPLTGSRREAFRTPRKTTSMVLSPDGSLISTIGTEPPGAIEIRSRSGKIQRTIRIEGWPIPSNQDWAADGRSLFVSHPGLIRSPSGPIGATILHVDFKGLARPIWDLRGARYAYALPSPDGKHMAFRGATTGRNAWLLEGF
jgi:DNA-binding winged helix-turn-helix (wHTH) protein/Tol biopolymer transport system component